VNLPPKDLRVGFDRGTLGSHESVFDAQLTPRQIWRSFRAFCGRKDGQYPTVDFEEVVPAYRASKERVPYIDWEAFSATV